MSKLGVTTPFSSTGTEVQENSSTLAVQDSMLMHLMLPTNTSEGDARGLSALAPSAFAAVMKTSVL